MHDISPPLIGSGDPALLHIVALSLAVNASGAIRVSTTPLLSVEEVEKVMLQEALGRSKGNVSEAARLLKVTRNTLHYRMGKYHLRVPEQSA